jgi:hypothetical protein
MRIAIRSSPRFGCAWRNPSCMSIAALAAPVTLGNSNQWPSPAPLIMWPSCLVAWCARKSRCLPRNACRSAASSSRKRDVEPLMSVFMTTVVRCGFILRHRSYALQNIAFSASLRGQLGNLPWRFVSFVMQRSQSSMKHAGGGPLPVWGQKRHLASSRLSPVFPLTADVGNAGLRRYGPIPDLCTLAIARSLDYVCCVFARMSRRRSKLSTGQTSLIS